MEAESVTNGVSPIDRAMAWQGIHDALIRYAHGLDRRDWTCFESAFWPDAIDDHGTFCGPVSTYLDHVKRYIPDGMLTAHTITNITVDFVRDDRAVSECYVTARHGDLGVGHAEIVTIGGRYIDLMERRGDEWRILHRKFVLEWHDSPPGTEEDMPASASRRTRGARGADDAWAEMRKRARD